MFGALGGRSAGRSLLPPRSSPAGIGTGQAPMGKLTSPSITGAPASSTVTFTSRVRARSAKQAPQGVGAAKLKVTGTTQASPCLTGPPTPSRRPTVVLIAAMAEHVVPRRGAVFDARSFFVARAWSPGRYDRGPPTI